MYYRCTNVEYIPDSNIETIIIIRHGEKPEADLGQLNCKGLNRSLALPKYFRNNFPKPDYIFAAPTELRDKGKEKYYYIRPLITIEPTAIYFEKKVNIGIPLANMFGNSTDVNKITEVFINELLKNKYHSSTIYIAWEHLDMPVIAEHMFARYNMDKSIIPEWKKEDFDTVYVFEINWNTNKLSFKIDKQGLNDVSAHC